METTTLKKYLDDKIRKDLQRLHQLQKNEDIYIDENGDVIDSNQIEHSEIETRLEVLLEIDEICKKRGRY